ncbi:CHAT domain-containing protein [Oerskovia enterophila]|uniref:CHAT domain-containing protein n=1 Tax=Oerskovia enterophila TaxID=43678 RepID=UPI0038142473
MRDKVDRARASYIRARQQNDEESFVEALASYRDVLDVIGDPRDAGDEEVDLRPLWARAILGTARCGYEVTGDLGEALHLLDDAESWCHEVGLAGELIAVQGQRGLLLLRAGDVTGALAELDRAAPAQSTVVSRDTAIVLLNRGALHLEVGAVDDARRDLGASVEHARAVGDVSIEAKGRHNLGYAEFLHGDLPLALRLMDEASELDPSDEDAVGLLDRAVVLQEAGLVTEAVTVLDRATSILDQSGSLADLARVRFDIARCLLHLRQTERAAELAGEAKAAFHRQSNAVWALRSELVRQEAVLAGLSKGAAPDDFREVARNAGEIADQAREMPPVLVGVPARVLQAEAYVRAGDVAHARGALEAVRSSPRSWSLAVRIQREAVRAMVAFGDGDRRRGLAAIRRGQEALVSHRSRLGSVDVVTASAVHGVRLGIVDVDAAFRTGRASAVFDAVERGRAAFAGTGRVRPATDPVLAELLASARREVEAARGLGTAAEAGALEERQLHLVAARRFQEEARRRMWQRSGDDSRPRPTSERSLRRALSALPSGPTVANIVIHEGHVSAVRVSQDGASIVRLAPLDVVAELVRRARADFAVLSNALIPAPMRSAATSSLRKVLVRLDDALLGPLQVVGDLHVTARDLLLAVPWMSLPSRAGARTWVNSWVDLQEEAETERPGGVVVVSGPGLLASDEETRLVARAWGGATLLTGADATCHNVVESLDGAGVVHLAAHGTHETDNPLFSSLRLTDGPLFAHELDGIDLSGAVVVLSACEVGLSSVRTGGEPLGLTSVLVRLGARAVIASIAPLRDDVAARVMPALHAELFSGAAPGEALARAIRTEDEPVPLVCFGPLAI